MLIDAPIQASAAYRAWQPFGQVPAYRDDDVQLFESGAIVLHIAAKAEALAPPDPAGLGRVASWVFAALNSIEPHVQNVLQFDGAGDARSNERRARLDAILNRRLVAVEAWLGEKAYLEGRFTAGDLIMTTVLCELVDCGALAKVPRLDAYRRRCEGRPAFRRALEAQLTVFRANAPVD